MLEMYLDQIRYKVEVQFSLVQLHDIKRRCICSGRLCEWKFEEGDNWMSVAALTIRVAFATAAAAPFSARPSSCALDFGWRSSQSCKCHFDLCSACDRIGFARPPIHP